MQTNSHSESRTLPIGNAECLHDLPRVLLLDRDVRFRAALTGNFLRHGWQVRTAENAQEALRSIDQQLFELVVSGLVLRYDALHELISALGRSGGMAPVIVLASQGNVSDIVQFMRAGAFDVLPRDTAFDVLQSAAKSAIRAFGWNQPTLPGANSNTPSMPSTGMTMSELNRKHLENALELASGNRTTAAKVLGISVRTVRNKIKEYGLPPRSYA